MNQQSKEKTEQVEQQQRDDNKRGHATPGHEQGEDATGTAAASE